MIIGYMFLALLYFRMKHLIRFFKLFVKRAHLFIPKSKWYSSDSIFVNDLCLFFLNDSQMKARLTKWHFGLVTEIKGSQVTLEYCLTDSGTRKTLTRCKRQLVRIAGEEELNLNDQAHFDKITKIDGLSINPNV